MSNNVASYHSVIDQLYRGDGKVNKIAQMLPTLLLDRPSLTEPHYSATSCWTTPYDMEGNKDVTKELVCSFVDWLLEVYY